MRVESCRPCLESFRGLTKTYLDTGESHCAVPILLGLDGGGESMKPRHVIALGLLGVACAKPRAAAPVTLTTTGAARATNETNAIKPSIDPATMQRIGSVESRYVSYNVEMAEVVGARFWTPYTASERSGTATTTNRGITEPFEKGPPIDLSNARLRAFAAALGPAYVRVSGTWANSVYFHDSAAPPPRRPPPGFTSVLTRAEWRGVIEFADVVDARIVTSFAISAGTRDASGRWLPDQASRIIAATHAMGSEIAAAELVNEPTLARFGGAPPGYDPAAFARDEATFRELAARAAPEMKIVGPGSVGEGVMLTPGPLLRTVDLLLASPKPVFDVFSYHFYGAASERCTAVMPGIDATTPEAASSEAWLSKIDPVASFYRALRDRFEPGAPIWVTETADAACGGNRWASTFRDTFRFVDQLGRLAKQDVKAVFHAALAGSDYGLLDPKTFAPRPDGWAALLWRRLMGATVLDAGPPPVESSVHLYAQCMRDRPGGVVLLAVQTGTDHPTPLDLPLAASRFTLSARTLDDTHVLLNGRPLSSDDLGDDGRVPVSAGQAVPAGRIVLDPATITFLAFAEAGNPSC